MKKIFLTTIFFFLIFFGFVLSSLAQEEINMDSAFQTTDQSLYLNPNVNQSTSSSNSNQDNSPLCGFPGQICCDTSLPGVKEYDNVPTPKPGKKDSTKEGENALQKMAFLFKRCRLGEATYDEKGNCTCSLVNEPTPLSDGYIRLCEKYSLNVQQKNFCEKCMKSGGYYSGLGCIPVDLGNFISNFLLGRLVGLAGFFALICIIFSSFNIVSSQGNTEKIKKAQELLTSCIIGLLFIIFSVFILKVIGVDILRIPF